MRKLSVLFAILALSLVAQRSEATVIKTFTGTTPDTNIEVSFTAVFTISGNTLTLVLSNDSSSLDPASPNLNPNDLLTSYYFDIFDGTSRPTLTYVSAITGDVFLTDKDNPDVAQPLITDMLADSAGDRTWQFRQGLDLLAGASVLTFGIGTAGNATFGDQVPTTCVTTPL